MVLDFLDSPDSLLSFGLTVRSRAFVAKLPPLFSFILFFSLGLVCWGRFGCFVCGCRVYGGRLLEVVVVLVGVLTGVGPSSGVQPVF